MMMWFEPCMECFELCRELFELCIVCCVTKNEANFNRRERTPKTNTNELVYLDDLCLGHVQYHISQHYLLPFPFPLLPSPFPLSTFCLPPFCSTPRSAKNHCKTNENATILLSFLAVEQNKFNKIAQLNKKSSTKPFC